MKIVGQISGGLDDRKDVRPQRNTMITLNRNRRHQIRHVRTTSLSNSMTQRRAPKSIVIHNKYENNKLFNARKTIKTLGMRLKNTFVVCDQQRNIQFSKETKTIR